jgi:hypothetical protein
VVPAEAAKEATMRRIKEFLVPVATALASGIMFAALALM